MASINGTYRNSDPDASKNGRKYLSQSTEVTPLRQVDGPSTLSRLAFLPLATVSQIVGVTCIALVIHWVVHHYGGFSWNVDANLQFNYHPVLMIVGLVFLYGDAMIVYRVFHFLPKYKLKIIHASLHVAAIVTAALGLVAVFENHRRTFENNHPKPDLYSLHSWVGLATYILFCLQYVSGFVAFLIPSTPAKLRSRVLPVHQFFGTAVFIMAIASALMGITEKLLWTPDYSKTVRAGIIGNMLGVLLVLFGFIIVFLTTHSVYKRKPLPSEIPAPVN